MTTALYVFLGSIILFTALSSIVIIERRKGYRLALGNVRDRIDRGIELVGERLASTWEHFTQYIVRLGWYYSLHSLLRTMLQVIVSLYEYIESHFERNRQRTRQLRSTRQAKQGSHLSAVAEHKAEVALTPEEEAALKERKLEDRD